MDLDDITGDRRVHISIPETPEEPINPSPAQFQTRGNTFLLKVFLFILIAMLIEALIFGAYFLYYVNNGKFQPNEKPLNANFSSQTSNVYEFNPDTRNEFNIVLNATIILPSTLNIREINST